MLMLGIRSLALGAHVGNIEAGTARSQSSASRMVVEENAVKSADESGGGSIQGYRHRLVRIAHEQLRLRQAASRLYLDVRRRSCASGFVE